MHWSWQVICIFFSQLVPQIEFFSNPKLNLWSNRQTLKRSTTHDGHPNCCKELHLFVKITKPYPNTGLVPSNKSNESFFGCQLLDVCPGRFALELQLHKKENSTFVRSNKKHSQSLTRTMNELITEIRKQINSQCVRDERSYWVGNICDKSTSVIGLTPGRGWVASLCPAPPGAKRAGSLLQYLLLWHLETGQQSKFQSTRKRGGTNVLENSVLCLIEMIETVPVYGLWPRRIL